MTPTLLLSLLFSGSTILYTYTTYKLGVLLNSVDIQSDTQFLRTANNWLGQLWIVLLVMFGFFKFIAMITCEKTYSKRRKELEKAFEEKIVEGKADEEKAVEEKAVKELLYIKGKIKRSSIFTRILTFVILIFFLINGIMYSLMLDHPEFKSFVSSSTYEHDIRGFMFINITVGFVIPTLFLCYAVWYNIKHKRLIKQS